jgi:hypothetical protein
MWDALRDYDKIVTASPFEFAVVVLVILYYTCPMRKFLFRGFVLTNLENCKCRYSDFLTVFKNIPFSAQLNSVSNTRMVSRFCLLFEQHFDRNNLSF